MFSLKEIRRKILKGDFTGVFRGSGKDDRSFQPSEVAQVFLSIPSSSAIEAFENFPYKNQALLFPYVDQLVQNPIILGLPPKQASFLLNNISSHDRLIFLSSLKQEDLAKAMTFLNEKNTRDAHDLLG